jgi:serine/threonine-protein kinase HipA
MTRTLEVHIADALAGVVTQRPGGNFRFEYDAAYAADRTSIPLSQSMPVTQRTHGTRSIANWMWGLLPDNEVTLNRWAQRYKVSARNPFAPRRRPTFSAGFRLGRTRQRAVDFGGQCR